LCAAPDGDLFRVLASGEAPIATDEIETFTETGISLKSAREIEADIIATATGLNLQMLDRLGKLLECGVGGGQRNAFCCPVFRLLKLATISCLRPPGPGCAARTAGSGLTTRSIASGGCETVIARGCSVLSSPWD
jgi:hypothetical protein